MADKTSLGDRMKGYYENRCRYFLPRRTNTIIRLDGKAFHTYTRGLEKPFDTQFIIDMQETTKFLCKSIQGVKLGYVQSDEISLWLTDYDKITTEAWFDGNIQKITSISAAMASTYFSKKRGDTALFDSRIFTIPEIDEVINYFIWRQQDATRNSIQSLAQSLYSHKELHKKNTDELQELCFQKGHNWNDLPTYLKRGICCIKNSDAYNLERPWWDVDTDIPIFTQDRTYLVGWQEFINEV